MSKLWTFGDSFVSPVNRCYDTEQYPEWHWVYQLGKKLGVSGLSGAALPGVSNEWISHQIMQNINNINIKYKYGVYNNYLATKLKSGYYTINPEKSQSYPLFINNEGISNYTLHIDFPDKNKHILSDISYILLLSLFFIFIIVIAFSSSLYQLVKQKKISEIKTDFINNMTHEFKTPLATISLAVDAMRNQKVIQDQEKMHYFSGIIKEENLRMNRQVETILKASQFDKGEVQLNLKPISVHAIVEKVVDNFTLQLEHAGGHITLFLRASVDTVEADEVHLSNLLTNLIDNAIKYAREQVAPQIQIDTRCTDQFIQLRVEDNGLGMNRDTLKRIFEKFYRAHTGNKHNVKGFGLGLSYVKSVTEAMGGTIKAESTYGKGSVFILELPLQHS